MDNEDARKLSQETQEQLRKQAIRLRKQGKTYKEIAQIVGVHDNTIWKWWKKYEAEGAKALKAQKRGRREGTQRSLDSSQEAKIQKLISDKTPDQLKLAFALWTRQAVQELIRLHCGFQMPIRTVGEYLKRWGFTPQKPLRRAYEQRPAEVQKWLEGGNTRRLRKEPNENPRRSTGAMRRGCVVTASMAEATLPRVKRR